jgi:hypothetical protein
MNTLLKASSGMLHTTGGPVPRLLQGSAVCKELACPWRFSRRPLKLRPSVENEKEGQTLVGQNPGLGVQDRRLKAVSLIKLLGLFQTCLA